MLSRYTTIFFEMGSGRNCPLKHRNCHRPQTSQASFTILKKKCLNPKLIKWHKKQQKPLRITLLREITLCPSRSLMPKKLKMAIQPNDECHAIFALFSICKLSSFALSKLGLWFDKKKVQNTLELWYKTALGWLFDYSK